LKLQLSNTTPFNVCLQCQRRPYTKVGGIRAATADQRRKDAVKTNENFYRHQLREKRRGELFELKQRFEAGTYWYTTT